MSEHFDLADRVAVLSNVFLSHAEDAESVEEQLKWVHRNQGAMAAWEIVKEARDEQPKGDSEGCEVSGKYIPPSWLDGISHKVPEVSESVRSCESGQKACGCSGKRSPPKCQD